jgi:hypothetical protein
MNKDQIIKSSWSKNVRLRPIPRRFDGGCGGRELPQLDRDWQIQQASKEGGVPVSDGLHGFNLNWDHIREYVSDSVRGDGYGFLMVKIQVNIGGNDVWLEPILP